MLRPARIKKRTRKLRLYGVACCRRILHLVPDAVCRTAVDAAERLADEQISDTEAEEYRSHADRIAQARFTLTHDFRDIDGYAEAIAMCLSKFNDHTFIVGHIAGATSILNPTTGRVVSVEEWETKTHLLREIFGNPFDPVRIDPAWLTPQVTAHALSIYDERRFADMPILADALEKAGCTNADVLNHCRQPGEHVRGCWVVDLLLGKE